MKKILDDYVPRPMRLGTCLKEPAIFTCTREVSQEVPVLSDTGSIVERRSQRVSLPVSEVSAKYRYEDFKLDNLIAAGVPLSIINIDGLQSVNMDQLNIAVQRLGSVESIEKAIADQQRLRSSWFDSSSDVSSDSDNV